MPKQSTDRSQICPENHKTSIIHAGFRLIFPSFLKPLVFDAKVCACVHKHEARGSIYSKEGKKKKIKAKNLMYSCGSRSWRIKPNDNNNFQRTKTCETRSKALAVGKVHPTPRAPRLQTKLPPITEN